MKKKLISILTALSMTIMLFTGMPISVSAEVVASGGCGCDGIEDDTSIITWSLDSNGVLTISGDGEMKNFTYDDKAPWKDSHITSAIIESGVTTIGKNAFFGCSELVSVSIPNTVTRIKMCAFMDCHKLKLDRLPESVFYIESQAFQGCYSLETLDMPGVFTIEYAAFEGCSTGQVNDMDITLCTGLKAVNMPEAVYIADSAFSRCFNLETVNAPKVKILNSVFQHCRMLTSVYIPSVKTIKKYAFSDCYRLLSFEIPPNVKVESKAFYGMTSSVIYYDKSCTVADDSFDVKAAVKYTVTDGETELEIVKAGNYSHVNFPETIGGGKVVSANWEEFLTDDYPKRELTHDGEHNADENMICRICGAGSGEHVHNYNGEWQTDELYHWKVCTKCNEEDTRAEHKWNGGIVTTEPTEENEGVKTFTCTICGKTRTGSIDDPDHTHSLTYHQRELNFDEADGYGHEGYWTCSGCSKIFLDESGKLEINEIPKHDFPDEWQVVDEAAHYKNCTKCGSLIQFPHLWNDGDVTTEPTEEAEGVKTYTCTVCEAEKTEPIDKLEHTHVWSDTYQHDADGHWKFCTKCTEADTKASHTWDGGTVTTEPTEETEGVKTYTCTVCSETKTESVEILPNTHKYSDEWTSDSTSHWHECECGEKSEFSVHISSGWIVETPAATEHEGVQIKVCTVCGTELDRSSIDKLPNSGSVTEVVKDTAGTNAGLVHDNTLIENVLTPEDKTEVENGSSFEIVLEVTDIRDSVPPADVTAASSALKSDEEIGVYVDLSLFKIKNGTEKTPIHNANGQIGITLTIPDSIYAADRTYSIIRVHSGIAENLGGTYDKANRRLTFYTDKFSTYAIAYTASNGGTGTPSEPSTPTVPTTPSTPTTPTTPSTPSTPSTPTTPTVPSTPTTPTTPSTPSVPAVTPTVTEKPEDEIIFDEPYTEDVSSAAGAYENDEADNNIHYILIVIFTAIAGISIIAAKKSFCKKNIK